MVPDKQKLIYLIWIKIYFFLLKRAIELYESVKSNTIPVILKNSYFAHHENVLLKMINDEDCNIRELGYRRILKARSNK